MPIYLFTDITSLTKYRQYIRNDLTSRWVSIDASRETTDPWYGGTDKVQVGPEELW